MRAPTQVEREKAAEVLAQIAQAPGMAGGVVEFDGDGLTEPHWRELLDPFGFGVEVHVPARTYDCGPELLRACSVEIGSALYHWEGTAFKRMVYEYLDGDMETAREQLPWLQDSVERNNWERRLQQPSMQEEVEHGEAT